MGIAPQTPVYNAILAYFQLIVSHLLSQTFVFFLAFINRFFSHKKPVNTDVYGDKVL